MSSSKAIPQTQKAWIVKSRGVPSEALTIQSDWPVPTDLAKGEILVKVEAAALNPSSYKLMRWLPNWVAKRPMAPEFDFAGSVVDANGTKFSDGDEVFGWLDPFGYAFPNKQGSLSQYIKVPASCTALRPSHISATDSAGVTLAAMTAYQALYSTANVQPGQTIFVNGGSSSVGAFAIQIAKAKGVKTIVASCSPKNEAFVRSLGADEVVDYTARPLHETLESLYPAPKFDAFIDAVGLSDPTCYTYSGSFLKPGAIFAATIPHPRSLAPSALYDTAKLVWVSKVPALFGGAPRDWRLVVVEHKEEDLEDIRRLLEEGSVKPIVDSVYEFEDALSAYDRIMSNRARGKVVVKIAQ